MVKGTSMKRTKRILLVAGVLLVQASIADAGLFGRKADAPKKAADAAPVSAITLSAVDVDGSRVLLRTNGAPAFTSYSPAPGVFIVDLTDTSRENTAVVPATLPPAVLSITADEVVEMGSALTRITFRLAESLMPSVTTIEHAVVVTIPATAIPIQTADSLPAVIPIEQAGAVLEQPATSIGRQSSLPRQRSPKSSKKWPSRSRGPKRSRCRAPVPSSASTQCRTTAAWKCGSPGTGS
jgi:hypothetical protein